MEETLMLVVNQINLFVNIFRVITLTVRVKPLKMLQKPDFSPNFP